MKKQHDDSLFLLMIVFNVLNQVIKGERKIMSTLSDVVAGLDAVAAGVDRLEAEIADLKAQVAAGHVITQEDLDGLSAKVAAIGSDIDDTSDQG